MLLAGGLAAASVLAGFMGMALLVAGIAMPSSSSGLGSLVSNDGPEKPGYEDGHPVGLYLMTRYWIATGSLEKAVWYFTSDGRVYKDPEDGFSDEKLAAHKGSHGTVTVEGDTMTIKWSDGKSSAGNFERAKGGFNWDMGIFAPVKGFTDDEHLVGRWEGGTSVSFSGSYAATSNSLDLKADGTFTGESVASLRSDSRESSVSAGSQGTTGGTWKRDGYALVFTYNDGRVVRGVTFPFDDEETAVFPDRFYFAGTMYKKLE